MSLYTKTEAEIAEIEYYHFAEADEYRYVMYWGRYWAMRTASLPKDSSQVIFCHFYVVYVTTKATEVFVSFYSYKYIILRLRLRLYYSTTFEATNENLPTPISGGGGEMLCYM